MPKSVKNPVLVAGTDGVGTKLKYAIIADKHDTFEFKLIGMVAVGRVRIFSVKTTETKSARFAFTGIDKLIDRKVFYTVSPKKIHLYGGGAG